MMCVRSWRNASVVTDRLVPVRRANEHIGNFHHRLIYREAQLADIETRHRVYSALLNHLTLASDHKQNLLDRGLTEEAIFKFQYRTTPLVGHETIAKTLVLEGLGFTVCPASTAARMGVGRCTSLCAES